ncbi:ras GEF [Backusella circina FSU 941]|nr:ras GEF [Backusella circina FSU 941]
MLVASGTLNKDSTLIKSNTALRSHHRSMMAIMSKVVLTAQMNADGSTSNAPKLITDCHELLLTVQNFTKVCESIPVELHYTDPMLLSPQEEQNSQWGQIIRRQNSVSSGTGSIVERGGYTKYELQSDLIESLDVYGAGMQESIKSLMASLTLHDEDSRSSLAILLFTEYRNFGNQNGQFLSIIEDIDFQSVIHSPLLKQLAVAKQKLYDGLGQLFFKMQAMTDDSVPIEQVKLDMQESAWSVTNAIKLVCDCMAELVGERALQEEKRNQDISYVDQVQSPSLIGSTDSIKDKSLSDFLKDSSNHLSFDLSLPSPHAFNSMPSNGLDATKIVSSTSKTSNRSSAPVADHSNDSDDSLPKKNRAQTLTESQSKQTSAKLKQLFNDDLSDSNSLINTPNSPTERRQSQDEVYPFLQYDYPPNEIVFTSDGSVKGGTLRALVERMTLHDYLDMNFNNTFLLTYRSFCSSRELLELLQARYNIQPPEGLTSEELDIWISKKQKLIRLRVFNVLKIWLEQYYYEEDSVILDRLLHFTSTSIKDSLSFSAHQLERLIQKRKEACKDLKKLVITHQVDSPDPILPRNLKKFRLLDLDTTEMARQLTIMDFKLYSSIKPVECLDKAWSKDGTTENGKAPIATNIKASIEYCNQITTWVSDEILSQSDVKKRSTIIKYWVNVAERCRLLNNFNTCMAILSAFDNSAVGRLKRTWELVGSRCNHIVSQIRKLMGANRNFNYYRALIHSANPPCIPFLGIYLQDLTFIEDGNPNFLKTSKDLINFAKRAKTAEVIRELQQYQSMGYQFRIVDEVQSFIMDNLHSARDEDQLYRESLKLEPKERDDEKITRLLQESGFL